MRKYNPYTGSFDFLEEGNEFNNGVSVDSRFNQPYYHFKPTGGYLLKQNDVSFSTSVYDYTIVYNTYLLGFQGNILLHKIGSIGEIILGIDTSNKLFFQVFINNILKAHYSTAESIELRMFYNIVLHENRGGNVDFFINGKKWPTDIFVRLPQNETIGFPGDLKIGAKIGGVPSNSNQYFYGLGFYEALTAPASHMDIFASGNFLNSSQAKLILDPWQFNKSFAFNTVNNDTFSVNAYFYNKVSQIQGTTESISIEEIKSSLSKELPFYYNNIINT